MVKSTTTNSLPHFTSALSLATKNAPFSIVSKITLISPIDKEYATEVTVFDQNPHNGSVVATFLIEYFGQINRFEVTGRINSLSIDGDIKTMGGALIDVNSLADILKSLNTEKTLSALKLDLQNL